MIWFLALALQAAGTGVQAPPSEEIVVHGAQGCGPPFAKVYIAPMGEPIRTDGFIDPMRKWFDQADADHNGKLTLAELQADSDRFFSTLDKDKSGELDPQEMSDYENIVAPEIKLYQPGQDGKPRTGEQRHEAKKAARSRANYEAPYGAGLWASLNIPEPIAAADYDLNRGISRAELAQAAVNRWPLLDPQGLGYLSYATLPKSPAQMDIDACRAAEDKKRR
ncbi:EF-hand domain-containing protein [Sphingomonas sp. CGMCC 1.13654]|uniref:EF-hand domain-containing protein n=1 Tax=Sphingomonas chungangi TaxID=2683589 RepID=A0A838LB83_9SPHN|nr:EF-hand domain-containing protein [Sphingomonas chungangi]MBA2935396.1 EF-hand domain-containing protein [Sphingomonas chungangi]MVW56902.1 EF-hand domain-containing protein [Sphingomonas chungangi]